MDHFKSITLDLQSNNDGLHQRNFVQGKWAILHRKWHILKTGTFLKILQNERG